MSVAGDMQRIVSERGGANLEFAGEGYQLSLNPVEDRFDEVGFILWREEGGGPAPVAVGRAVGDRLVLDDGGGPGTHADVSAVISSLIGGEPVSALGGGGNEGAIPTGT
jgi:hypothetical protein